MPAAWAATAVAEFGRHAKTQLAGPGDREAAIRKPVEGLLAAAGAELHMTAVFYDEVRLADRQVRPDYAVAVDGVTTGYVEIKAPQRSIDPDVFRGHDRVQWERQRDLPNLVYTNGTEWRLYRDGAAVGEPVSMSGGPLDSAGSGLQAGDDLEALLTDFLRWHPAPITSVVALVRAVAPLTRLLRGEVLDQLEIEHRRVAGGADEEDQPFTGLARDWRGLLFPGASDTEFADGYAQTVTFALLLARTEGFDLDRSLADVADLLGHEHSLMGSALRLLTQGAEDDFRVTLDLLVRVVGAVQWPEVRRGKRDAYLHLYEGFLAEYDQELRKRSGSYYTPREVVEQMVRLTEQALTTRLGRSGFDDPSVFTVDPAMGTGTYLLAIIDRVAAEAEAADGEGIVPGVLTDLAKRLVGFEIQTGPYAVAELRTTDLMRSHGATPPPGGMRLYVTDTLDDPFAEQAQLGSTLAAISRSRSRADTVKRATPVTVVIGNPPYRERAEGDGGWVERGNPVDGVAPLLQAFREPGNGLREYVLKNLYVYFWRWATWKVFDDLAAPEGVVCFITTSGYLRGPGFAGMREYLRRRASEGWVIDLTPEGQQPPVNTRVFPGVQQPLAIGLFVRRADAEPKTAATIHSAAVRGVQRDKFAELAGLRLDGPGWRDCRSDWTAPFTPAADTGWDEFPALNDLFPWTAPGIKPNRTWVYAPSADVLAERWNRLIGEPDTARKRQLFKETRDAGLDRLRDPLPGRDVHRFTGPFANEHSPAPAPVRVGYRSFDRQWVFPDSRLIDYPRPDLWSTRVPGRIFVVEEHSRPSWTGSPGIVLSSLMPDMDYFNGRGGRVLPLFHPDGSANLAPGLLPVLATALGREQITALDLAAYVAGVVAHPGYTATFADELTTPGVRVPVTGDGAVWDRAVDVGLAVLWCHTYGAVAADPAAGRPQDVVRYPPGDLRQPRALKPIGAMPTAMAFTADPGDPTVGEVRIGIGTFGPVQARVWDYAVGGRNVLGSWFGYRRANPAGRRSSPLDDINATTWPADWTREFIDLLTVLTRLTELEDDQARLLADVLAGPLLTRADLAGSGVRWPAGPKDRRPRHRIDLPSLDAT